MRSDTHAETLSSSAQSLSLSRSHSVVNLSLTRSLSCTLGEARRGEARPWIVESNPMDGVPTGNGPFGGDGKNRGHLDHCGFLSVTCAQLSSAQLSAPSP